MTDPAPKPMPPRVKMALEIEKVMDHDGDRPLTTDAFNAICDICEKWLCRPNLETQAVAQLEVRNGIAGLKHLLAPIDQVSDGMMLYRSPVEAVPVSALRELEAEMRAVETNPVEADYYRSGVGWCADRLSAVIRGTKT